MIKILKYISIRPAQIFYNDKELYKQVIKINKKNTTTMSTILLINVELYILIIHLPIMR